MSRARPPLADPPSPGRPGDRQRQDEAGGRRSAPPARGGSSCREPPDEGRRTRRGLICIGSGLLLFAFAAGAACVP